MTTNKHSETPVLQLLQRLEVGGGQLGNGQTIFELWADKGGIDPGTKEKRESIPVNTDVVEKTHYFHNGSRARRDNQGRLNTFRTKGDTKVDKRI